MRKFIPPLLIDKYHLLLAFLGAVLYRFPSKQIKVIGITGTKGKSTVINLAGHILEEAGFKVGWVSSLSLKAGTKEWLNPWHLTMPGRFFLQRFLRGLVRENSDYCLIEATSEGILQHRHRFIDFDLALLTNLKPEHIERHGSFEKYREAKAKLFRATKKLHLVNLDDENAEYFLQFPADEKWGYGISLSSQIQTDRYPISIIEAREVKIGKDYSSFLIHNSLFKIPLLGRFNLYNALAAIAVARSQGVDLETCSRALAQVKGIPGRMEEIKEGQDFRVFVDLAHTPDSFEKIFELAKGLSPQRIISVFGAAGGGRDKWKRPELGQIAARYSDQIVLTNEDPYDENPLKIMEEIAKGIKNHQPPTTHYQLIEDRREAIAKALGLARPGDMVLILGKGTEQTMVIGSRKIPWDDRKVVREEIKRRS